MKKASILVVEDEGIVALDLKRILENLDYEVCGIAATGEEAIKITESERPDVVLMDIRLPGGMDGIEAGSQIRSLFNTPVIHMTAYSDDTMIQKAGKAGTSEFIFKPFIDGDLSRAIDKLLTKKANED